MSGRFLAVLDLQAHAPGRDVEQLAARLDLDIAWAKPGLAILADAALGRVGLGDHGLVLGRLLHRHGPARPIDRLDENDIGRIVEETGTLSRLHWGSYVALIESGGRFRVERDPSGAMPCYMARRAGMWAFSSRADLLCRAGFARPLICWRSLGRQLYRAGLPTSRTALADIEELLPGFAIESPDFVPMSRWSPWDDAAPADMPDMDALAETLARQVRLGVRGLCDGMGRILVSLSGGLDSALVAACLAEAGHDLVCLNLHTDDPHGDERAYARALCAHLGLRLVERRYRLEDVDIAAPLNAHLPRPVGRSQALAYERAHLAVAHDEGIKAFATGNGGDNVFAHSHSAAPIVDRYRHDGIGIGVARTLLDTCRQTGASPWAVMRAALASARKVGLGYRWRPRPDLLHPELETLLASEPLAHPWLDPSFGAAPGKAAHIAALLRVQQTQEPMRARFAPVLNPLLAQPIVEACLAIPTWQWRTGGIDRAVVRQAFAKLLPAEIRARRGKGGPDAFSIQVIRANLDLIRARLLGGRLARHDLLDLPAIERVLGNAALDLGSSYVRLQELLVAEAWADHWSGWSPPRDPF